MIVGNWEILAIEFDKSRIRRMVALDITSGLETEFWERPPSELGDRWANIEYAASNTWSLSK